VFSIAHVSFGYSVLTHEAIIDSTWDSDIKPLLLKRKKDQRAWQTTLRDLAGLTNAGTQPERTQPSPHQ
jgi:hypothetical protein